MANYIKTIKFVFVIMIIAMLTGCGDEENTLPWSDQIDIVPSVYDLSNAANPRSILVTFAPYDELGAPFTTGNTIVYINDEALGTLAAGEESGAMLSLDYNEDGVVNCWYRPTSQEEIVTIYAYADQFPHPNVQAKQLRIVNQVVNADFAFAVNGLIASFVNGSVRNDLDSTTVGDATPTAGLVYSWTFGDGGVSAVRNPPPHTYAAAGTYIVTLFVTDADGTIDTMQEAVTVTGA